VITLPKSIYPSLKTRLIHCNYSLALLSISINKISVQAPYILDDKDDTRIVVTKICEGSPGLLNYRRVSFLVEGLYAARILITLNPRLIK